jgi:hypothetical protein
MHVDLYNVFYLLNSHQHVSVAILAIFRLMMLLEEYKSTNVVSCVSVAS